MSNPSALYADAYLKWLIAKRDMPWLTEPEPVAKAYGVTNKWLEGQLKRQVELDFRRPVA